MTDYLLSYEGSQGATLEAFTHTLVVNALGMTQETVAEKARDAFEAAVATEGPAFDGAFNTLSTWEQVKAAEILDLFEGTLFAASTAEFNTPKPSGSGTSLPFQIATAVSLRAGTRPNGTPLRGRFYVPQSNTANVDSLGRWGATYMADLAAFIGVWFVALNDESLIPRVWSRTLGVTQTVESVRIGNIPDTIRSRRSQQVELYTDVDITPGP